MKQLQVSIYQDGVFNKLRIDERELKEKHNGSMEKYIVSRGLNPANIFGFRFISREDEIAQQRRRPPVGSALVIEID